MRRRGITQVILRRTPAHNTTEPLAFLFSICIGIFFPIMHPPKSGYGKRYPPCLKVFFIVKHLSQLQGMGKIARPAREASDAQLFYPRGKRNDIGMTGMIRRVDLHLLRVNGSDKIIDRLRKVRGNMHRVKPADAGGHINEPRLQERFPAGQLYPAAAMHRMYRFPHAAALRGGTGFTLLPLQRFPSFHRMKTVVTAIIALR